MSKITTAYANSDKKGKRRRRKKPTPAAEKNKLAGDLLNVCRGTQRDREMGGC